ncbi:Polyketide synthase [Desmonostoc muscorum LEGE 12446]|nr:type I polyketide synthase [Desmonostoc muscorum]MCF2150415.1 Polyketide synthase [Desmonostoc muscorum LEGE 12446]
MSENSVNTDRQSLMKKALLELKEMKSQLAAVEKAKKEPIAIVGMGCRFPGDANNPEAFWQLLCDGVDAVTEVPANRWDINALYDPNPDTPGKMYTRYGGFLRQLEEFDAQFFGISPKEAVSLDPQQRLLLEVTWEALENASIKPAQLLGTQTGVFIGITGNDYLQRLLTRSATEIDAYQGTGNTHSVAAGRLSYILGLTGPSLAVDTACSSSLVAVHLACQSLRHQESDLAIAGGVNLLLSSEVSINLSKARMLSSDGRCKTFDTKADGYVRSEGCGVIILKRLCDAIKDKDQILALIRGSAVNQDGRSSGLTVPNGPAQQAVIRQALENGGVEPTEVSYLEAHGTGTSLGDPIEVGALEAVFGKNRPKDQPLTIGSLKTNIGHLESAAGIAGIIKVVLQMQHQEIAPHLHFQDPSPHINWENLPLIVPTQKTDWQTAENSRLAGVSSFGFSGTNAHVVLAQAPTLEPLCPAVERPLHLLTLSAKTPSALEELAFAYQNYIQTHADVSIADICYTANIGREHFNHRLAIVTGSREQLVAQLAVLTFAHSDRSGKKPLKIAFLFTGQGSQYINMGRLLYETQPIFRQTLEQCDEILRPYLEPSLLEVLYPTQLNEQVSSLLNQTAYTQPALFAFEYALYQLWKSWGIQPDVVMGHSVGEYVAATVAGVFSLEDGLKLIAQRGQLMQQLPDGGEMVSLIASEEQVRQILAPFGNTVSIAAINSSESVVISGVSEDITTLCQKLEAQGVKTKRLQVSHAFHSPLMIPMLQEFEQVANHVTYNQPQIPLISNVTGQLADENIATGQYWVNHVLQTVQFATSMQTLHQQDYEVFLEIGPKPILLGMGRECLPDSEDLWLPSLRPGVAEWEQLLSSLGELYLAGVQVDWSGFEGDYPHQKVALPNYPFQRQRYWIENPPSRHEQPESLSEENIQTPIVNLLNQGNTQELVQLVQKALNFSPEQIKLLPEILAVLVREHKQHLIPDNIQDLCYELVWRNEGNIQQQLLGDYIPAPSEISDRLQPQTKQLMSQHHQLNAQVLVQLEALSIAYAIAAFHEMGWNFHKGQRFSLTEIVQQLGVVDQHSQLMHRLLEMLVEVEILEYLGEQWQIVAVPKIHHPQSQISDLLSQYPNAVAELTILQRCGSNLAQVLRGECNPVELLFPEGDLTTATQLYQDAPEAKLMNTLMQQAVLSVVENLPSGRKLRVLEIGAGTGGTTSYLLPFFNEKQTEYIFTDLSPFFLAQAQQKFQDFSFVKYQLLDIEQAAQSQGFAENQYDLIVASNVLHATKDMRITLQHVHQLLAPQGMLLLLEATHKSRWLDLIFGLTDGWWRFTDFDLRPNHPLLTTNSWQKLLYDSDFQDVATIVPSYQETISQQALILAQAVKPKESKTESENWLIFADRQGIGQELSLLLRSQQKACTLVFSGNEYKQISDQEFTINPALPEDFQRLLLFMEALVQGSKSLSNPQLHGVVYLWSLDTVEAKSLTVTDLEVASQTGCGGVLSLIQSLINQGFSHPPRLWLVTKGAQRVGVESSLGGVAQSSVWGLGKVITDEHPEFNCTLVDLDVKENHNAQSLFAEISSHKSTSSETDIAFRNGQRYVSRLVRSKKIVKQSLRLKADATYLITGGLGEIGLLVAQWLVEHGAKYLVLAGRSSPNEAAEVTLRRLKEAGSQVIILQTDVSLEKDVTSLLTQIKTSMPELRGIIHTAGVFEDRLLVDHQWQLFAKVFAPKVSGAWNLHIQTQDLPLDFFVLFSSVASMLGSAGLANYAAANAFLDALAHYRRLLGLPGLSINWGPWSMVGMARDLGIKAEVKWATKGIKPMEPHQALSILENLLPQDAAQVGVTQLNWSKFLQQFSGSSYPSFVSEIAQQVQELTIAQEQQKVKLPPLLDQIKANSQEQNQSLLITYLREQIAKALGTTTSALNIIQPLNQMGLDSLMVVELKNRLRTELEINIPITKFLDGVSVVDLTKFVSEQLFEVNSISKAPLATTTASNQNNWIEGEL